jgi:hypothetical protein
VSTTRSGDQLMRARDQRQHRNLSAQYLKLGKMSR